MVDYSADKSGTLKGRPVDISINYLNRAGAIKPLADRPRWLRGTAFAWGTEGCGFDPQPQHTKSRKKMVPL